MSLLDLEPVSFSKAAAVKPQDTPRVAVYPGTFDPPHEGHLDIYRQATWNFDKVIIAIARNAGKVQLLDPRERQEAWQKIIERPQDEVVIATPATAPITDVVSNLGGDTIIRGLRGPEDMAAERAFREFVERTASGTNIVYYMCARDLIDVSGTTVKQLAQLKRPGELLRSYLPWDVLQYILDRGLIPKS